MKWPNQNTPELVRFYGNPVGENGVVNPQWKEDNLMLLPVPYKMVLAWDHSKVLSSIWIHHKCAVSLDIALKAILGHFGTQAEIEKAGMDQYGGTYTYRRITNGTSLSMHAYGCAIDLDPERNQYNSRHWHMPPAVVQIFEYLGWTWGGRWRHHPDAMHFQAANV